MSASRAVKPSSASAKTDVDAPIESVQIAPVTRREFLFYVWGASMALLLGASGGLIIWFALPRFEEGEFGGVFNLGANDVPPPGEAPIAKPEGKFWMSNDADKGIVAIYAVCTHLGCLYAWVSSNFRFECPCHGSKFTTDGTWIEGPAPRSLDRFTITVTKTDGTSETSNVTGDPIFPGIDPLEIDRITVDTGDRIQRSGRV